jgi:hypothetical protein
LNAFNIHAFLIICTATDPICDLYNLSLHTYLKTLILTDADRITSAERSKIDALYPLISGLCSPALEVVSLDLPTWYSESNMALCDAFFTLARFPKLEKVIFLSTSADVAKNLPRLSESGLLQFDGSFSSFFF